MNWLSSAAAHRSHVVRSPVAGVDAVRSVLDDDWEVRRPFSAEHAVDAALAASDVGLGERELTAMLRDLAGDDLGALCEVFAHGTHTWVQDAAVTAPEEGAALPDPEAQRTASALVTAGRLLRIAAGADGTHRTVVVDEVVGAALQDGDDDICHPDWTLGTAALALATAASNTNGSTYLLLADALLALPARRPPAAGRRGRRRPGLTVSGRGAPAVGRGPSLSTVPCRAATVRALARRCEAGPALQRFRPDPSRQGLASCAPSPW